MLGFEERQALVMSHKEEDEGFLKVVVVVAVKGAKKKFHFKVSVHLVFSSFFFTCVCGVI